MRVRGVSSPLTILHLAGIPLGNNMKLSYGSFIAGQLNRPPPVVSANLSGQTVVVVGANTGLGFEATKHFAKMGPRRLILACRSQSRGDAALAKLAEETGYTSAEVWIIDLADFASVRRFADMFEKDDLRLDILVANAALATFERNLTKDGWEETLQVNDLSTSLLCLLLAPRIVETGRRYGTNPRIVIVTSGMHYWYPLENKVYEAPSPLKLLNSKEYSTSGAMAARYAHSKLINVFMVMSLAELLKDTPVLVVAVCPGYCVSELRRNFVGVTGTFTHLLEKAIGWTTEEGGRQLVYGAVGDPGSLDALRGAYLDHTKIVEPSDHCLGDSGKRRQAAIWDDIIRELCKIDERVVNILQQYEPK